MNQQHQWTRADVQEQPGIRAQGNDKPLSLFANHIVAQADSSYYDVSYGNTASADPFGLYDLRQHVVGLGYGYETMVDETVAGIDYNADGDADDEAVTIYVIKIRKTRPNNVELLDWPMPYTGTE